MLVVKPTMVVAFLINLDVTLLIMCARVVNPMMIVHLLRPIAMLMVLAKIAENKDQVQIIALVELSLMVLLVPQNLTPTVIPSLVSAWISVSKTLIVILMPANLDVKLNVVAVWNVQVILNALSNNGEEQRLH